MLRTIPDRPLSLQDKAAEARRKALRSDPRGLERTRTDYLTRTASFSPRSSNLRAGTPEEADAIDEGRMEAARRQFIEDSVNERNRESFGIIGRGIGPGPIPGWYDFADQMNASEAAAAWEGKNFQADLTGIGQSPSRRAAGSGGSNMPRAPRGLESDGFDVSDDPRVQQAMVRRALDALDPMAEEAARGREMQDSALERNASEQRNLRSARDYAMPMHRIKTEMGDITSNAEALREWFPARQSLREQDFNRKRELAIGPAEAAAEGRIAAEGLRAQGAVGAAQARQPDPTEIAAKAIADMTRSGAFGVDRNGRPIAPPPDLQQRAIEQIMGLLQGGQLPPSGQPRQPQGAPAPGGQVPMTSGPAPANPTVGARHRFPNGRVLEWDGQGWFDPNGG